MKAIMAGMLGMALLAGAAGLAGAADTGFNQTAAGPYDYNTGGNWVGSTISGVWHSSLTLSAGQTAYFGADTVLDHGWSFGYTGAQDLTLRGNVADRLVTLGGNAAVDTVADGRTVTIGSGAAGTRLNIDLGASDRTFSAAGTDILVFRDVISSTGAGKKITKTGSGTLYLNPGSGVNNTFTGGFTLEEGTVRTRGVSAFGTAATAGKVTIKAGTKIDSWNNDQHQPAGGFSFEGDFTFLGSDLDTLGGGSSAITLTTDVAITCSASTLTLSGSVGESGGARRLTKRGAGVLTLSAANTFSGGLDYRGAIKMRQLRAIKTGKLILGSGSGTRIPKRSSDFAGPTAPDHRLRKSLSTPRIPDHSSLEAHLPALARRLGGVRRQEGEQVASLQKSHFDRTKKSRFARHAAQRRT
jgi:autotransporter-associated beta strand protein